ncbi:hypothetical protein L6R52_12720 [Myxococcota bacterium]|nr:hypothetical protein [Myxococcota bacterium]
MIGRTTLALTSLLTAASIGCSGRPSGAPDAAVQAEAAKPAQASNASQVAQQPAGSGQTGTGANTGSQTSISASGPTKPRAVPPMREATKVETEAALKKLQDWVLPGASDNRNAWALAHGLVGWGPSLKAADGRLAVEAIVEDYIEQKVNDAGKPSWYFPEATPSGVPVEPHRDLVLKTMMESGVPLTRKFKTRDGKTVTPAEIAHDAEARFTFPRDDAGWRNYAWSVYSFFLASKGENAKAIKTAQGSVTLLELAARTVARLEEEQQFLEEVFAAKAYDKVDKRRQGIYAHHCGGLHFVQAAALGASVTQDANLKKRVLHQLEVVLFRWEAERRIYKEVLAEQPQYKWLILVQELKFYGHVMETFALARDYGVLPKDAETERKLRMVAADLVDVVAQLEPAYRSQDVLAQVAQQTRYDLIGDGCHAIRGLRRGLVAFFAP